MYAVAHDYAVYAVQAAGGTVTNDLSQQIGVLIAESTNANFATLVQQYAVANGYAVIQSISTDKATKQKEPPKSSTPRPDPREAEQWGMTMIRSDRARFRELQGRAGRVAGRDRCYRARPDECARELLELRLRRRRRRCSGRPRPGDRLEPGDPVDDSRLVGVAERHVDGIAACGRRRGAHRKPVRHARCGRRRGDEARQVQAKLQGTATDIGARGYDEYFGYGRIDALRAIGG